MATAATSTNDRLNLYVSKCELKEILLTIINAVQFPEISANSSNFTGGKHELKDFLPKSRDCCECVLYLESDFTTVSFCYICERLQGVMSVLFVQKNVLSLHKNGIFHQGFLNGKLHFFFSVCVEKILMLNVQVTVVLLMFQEMHKHCSRAYSSVQLQLKHQIKILQPFKVIAQLYSNL